jgi:hypothetical protein
LLLLLTTPLRLLLVVLMLTLRALLSPGWRCPCCSRGSVIRGEIHLLATINPITIQALLLPPLAHELLLLLLAMLLQKMPEVRVVHATCCCDKLLCCPTSLLEPPHGEHGSRCTAMHGSLALLLLLLHALQRLVLLQLLLQLQVGCLTLYRPLHVVSLKLFLHALHLLLLALHAILQHLRLLMLRKRPALPVESLLLLVGGEADVACNVRHTHDWGSTRTSALPLLCHSLPIQHVCLSTRSI